MSNIRVFITILVIAVVLTACGNSELTNELDRNDSNKATAKVESSSPSASASESQKPPEPSPSESSNNEKDIWTYYEEAKWSDDFNGLKSEIQKVVVTDKAPTMEEQDKYDHSAVGVKFRLENTTEGIFTTYPDQAELITSTGEQIEDPDMWVSDHLGGEIEEGVIKEGNIIWYLTRGHAEDIEWIKMKWYAVQGDSFDGERKEYSVKLQLK